MIASEDPLGFSRAREGHRWPQRHIIGDCGIAVGLRPALRASCWIDNLRRGFRSLMMVSAVLPGLPAAGVAADVADEPWDWRVSGVESAVVQDGWPAAFDRNWRDVTIGRNRGLLLRFSLENVPLASSVNAVIRGQVKTARDGLSPCLVVYEVEGKAGAGNEVKVARRLAEVAFKPGWDGLMSLPVTAAFLGGLPGKTVTFLVEVLAPAEGEVVVSGAPELVLAKQEKFAFDTGKWLIPLWQTTTIIDETILPVARDGQSPAARLLFEPREILSVRDYGLATNYAAGRDYLLEGRTIRLPESSAIPFLTREELFPANPGAKPGTKPAREGGYLAFGEGSFFNDHQSAVTYRTDEVWPGPTPIPAGDLLPRTFGKLKRGESLKLVVFGDSISRGASASGWGRRPPYLPPWPDLVGRRLTSHYGSVIESYNLSLGGMRSDWGREHAAAFVAPLAPDLVIIGFGMNDAGAVAAKQFRENLESIMTEVRKTNPRAEFLLLMTFQPNPAWRNPRAMTAYRDTLRSMEGPGVAVADLWEMHGELLKQKSYEDTTGNHVNHPNDFIVRLYAQVVLARLGVATDGRGEANGEPASKSPR
jgi:lysophospholipase L1-like esterase